MGELMNNFVRGKRYRLDIGSAAFFVTEGPNNHGIVSVEYEKSGLRAKYCKDNIINFEEDVNMFKNGDKVLCYTFGGSKCYEGFFIGDYNENSFVVKKANTGALKAILKGNVKPYVKPTYVVTVKDVERNYQKHYFSKEGDVGLGDQLLINNRLHLVTGVDTREKAHTSLNGFKLNTTPIPQHYNE